MTARGARLLLLLAACAGMANALAGDICPGAADEPAASYGSRIAEIACAEHRLWYRPFITDDGRLASARLSEGESSLLADGATPVWRRVVEYWSASGLLPTVAGRAGAGECAVRPATPVSSAACRGFVLDTPWSAAFVSFVLVRSGVPGFRPSASHLDFVRDAYRRPDGPYRLVDPRVEAPRPGDLLCYARAASAFGPDGFVRFLREGADASLGMHCDVVVDNATAAGRVYTVGGNVQQGVTLRMLDANRQGRLWSLPRRNDADPPCQPESPAACNFNRQDWVALLKLKPLPPPLPASPTTQACCTACTLPMPPDVRRCPVPPADPVPDVR